MTETDQLDTLTPGARRLMEVAQEQHRGDTPMGVFEWLLALVQRHGPIAESLSPGLQAGVLRQHLAGEVAAGRCGDPLSVTSLLTAVSERARAQGKEHASERDVAAVVLAAASYPLAVEERAHAAAPAAKPSQSSPDSSRVSTMYHPSAKRPTPVIEQYGRDLTRIAQEGRLNPVVGREEELELMIETLCRSVKRNPVLVGPAGVGKTAIVEGLAQRVVSGDVPKPLLNVRILEIQPSTLVAGSGVVGELNERMKGILAEASQEGIILFIDELHSLVGAGGSAGSGDVASLLKPALARGDIACIGATTDDEFRRFIEPDAALERRFQPIRVQEMDADGALAILHALRDKAQPERGVNVPDDVLAFLVMFAEQNLRNRTFPDKAVDLFEQSVAYAVAHDHDVVTQVDAATVAQRLIGMPVDLDDRLRALSRELDERGLLLPADREALLERLTVTMRGLDVRASRANAVVLLAGEAIQWADSLASTIAISLFGTSDRVVEMDFGRMTNPSDVTLLVGAPPGYIGYSDRLPIHRLAQMPFCVVLCHNVQAAYPTIQDMLAAALENGFFTDAVGRRIYLSDAVVILTADVGEHEGHAIGFRTPAQSSPSAAGALPRALRDTLPESLLDTADIVSTVGSDSQSHASDLAAVLHGLSEQYRRFGKEVQWDPSVVTWLQNQLPAGGTLHEWERLVDRSLTPRLVSYLSGQPATLTVAHRADGIHVEVTR